MKRKFLIGLITFIALILVFGAIILAVCFWPTGKLEYTLSEDGSYYTVKGNGYFGKEIVIEETYNSLPVTSINERGFVNQTRLKKIIIPESITSIGKGAFDGCSNLTSITLPNKVTLIGAYVFRGCSSLTNISIPNYVTSIGSEAFSGCSSLQSIELPDSVVTIGTNAFYGCNSITKVAIPNSVTSIGRYAFKDCSEVTSIIIPDSVTSIGSTAFSGTAFYNNLNNWEDNVLYIGNHLIEAKSDITDSYTIKNGTLTIAEYAFSGCKSITNIIIPYGLNSINDYAFAGCYRERSDGIGNYGLLSVTIPVSVTNIGREVFMYSFGLRDVIFEGTLEQWNSINKEKGWGDSCGNYTIHCTNGDISVRG